MKVKALVVGDVTQAGKKDPTKSYRTITLVDQDADIGNRLETMFSLSIPEDTNLQDSLAGAVVTVAVKKIEESDFRGLQFRGHVLTVEGVMRFEPANPKVAAKG